MSPLLSTLLVRLAEVGGEEPVVNHTLSYGIGALVLAILLGLMGILVAFGGGREHT